MEREGISTLSIHGYPGALSYFLRSLTLHFQLFEMVLCVCGFEICFEKRPSLWQPL